MQTIRSVTASDIPPLSELWYDRMVFEQQMGQGIVLSSNAIQVWQTAAQQWMNMPDTLFLILSQDEPIGCIVIQIVENRPGLLPKKIGLICELIVDLHTKQGQGGVGKQLLDAGAEWLRQHKIEKLIAQVSLKSMVEQSFWRSVNAKQTQNIFEWTL